MSRFRRRGIAPRPLPFLSLALVAHLVVVSAPVAAAPSVVGDGLASARPPDDVPPSPFAAVPRLLATAIRAYEHMRAEKGSLAGEGVEGARRQAGGQFLSQATLLGDADDLLAAGNARGALKRLGELPAARAFAELRAPRYLLQARSCAKLGDHACVVATLADAEAVLDAGEFTHERVFLAFTAAVDGREFDAARALYARARAVFEREFLPEKVEMAEVALARWLAPRAPSEALRILRRVGRNYPAVAAAREAYAAYSEIACGPELGTIDAFFGETAAEKREFARTILRRLGPVDDVRALAFSLADIPDLKELRAKKLGARSMEERADLLDKAEFLLAVRESKLAAEFTRYLAPSKFFGPGFERDRVLFLAARGLNAVDKPEEAARSYARVFNEFPRSPLAQTARQRWILSLHYAQRFKEVAVQTRRAAGRASRSEDARWRSMWAEYLAGGGDAFLADARAGRRWVDASRVEYWLGRDLERQGRGPEARAVYMKLSEEANHSHYGLLARWRLVVTSETGLDAVRLASKGATGLDGGLEANIRQAAGPERARLRVLVDAGLQEFARARVAESLRREGRSESVVELARIAYSAHDFRSASLFPRRALSTLQNIPSRGADLKRSLQEDSQLWRLSFPLAYGPVVEGVARELKMDPFLVLGVMRAESNYDAEAVSWVGARGLMQIMPYTGHRIARLVGHHGFDTAELNRPDVGIAFGAWYLKRLLTYYKGNLVLAIAAYNAGPEAVDRWLRQSEDWDLDEFVENIPYDQTRQYVGKVLVNMDMYHRLYGVGGKGLSLDVDAELPKPAQGMEMF